MLGFASWSDRRRKADRVPLIPPLKNCPGLYFSPSKSLQSSGWEMALEIARVWGWGSSCFLVATVVLFLDLWMGEGRRGTSFCDVL